MGIENMDRIVKKGDKKVKLLLLICNAVIIAVMLTATIFYSKRINTNQKEAKTEDFIRTVESLKQVGSLYFRGGHDSGGGIGISQKYQHKLRTLCPHH